MNLKQAVILCGGLGTRLRPLTDHLPKPMVPIHGRPFLEYLIEQLKANGIAEVVLLTGYKKEKIEEYFGDGTKFGIKIDYSRGEVEWETGKRLYQARNRIDEHFLLLYGDNFSSQFNLQKLVKFHQSRSSLVTLSLFSKAERNNIIIDEENKIIKYDPKRELPNLKYVEIGYMLVNKDVFKLFDNSNFSFSVILEKLSKLGRVYGLVTQDQYYSISDPERLTLTEEYLSPKKIIILDRDGVINQKAPRGEYITKWEEFRFIPGIIDLLKNLGEQGYSFIIISNQAGIARGKYIVQDLERIHQNMLQIFKENNIKVLSIYYCPHHWEEKCECRKPAPGMFVQASKDFKFRLDQTIYIGDDERDWLAAHNSNCKFIMYGNEYDKQRLSEYLQQKECTFNLFAENFNQVKRYILNEVEKSDNFQNAI